jgi:peptidoglycan/xylan/chitin deacetylase (PgdA/CDA1 family)
MPIVSITIDTEFPDQAAKDPLGAGDELLQVLAKRNIKATFFIVGAWARANPERVIAIRDAGHHIGNHSYSHCSLKRMTGDGIVEDLAACDAVLSGLGVETRPWFRAPYGEIIHDAIDAEAAIRQAGYRHVHWHARGEDWRAELSAAEVAEMALIDVHRRWPRPAIVLFHSWPDSAPRALELLLDRLRSERAEFVTVDAIGLRHRGVGLLRSAASSISLRSGTQ